MADSNDEHGVPPEGLECLATMEDITLEDGNYGKFLVKIEGVLLVQCSPVLFSVTLIHMFLSIYSVEYQSCPSMKWKPALYEKSVIEKLLKTQFHEYIEKVKTTDCQAELRRLLATGPPTYLSDDHALPLEENDTHVGQVWFACDKSTRSALLEGAKLGTERQELWDELKKFIIEDGKEDEDE